jgi:hypothetical protein
MDYIETEYIATTETCQEVVWLSRLACNIDILCTLLHIFVLVVLVLRVPIYSPNEWKLCHFWIHMYNRIDSHRVHIAESDRSALLNEQSANHKARRALI